MPHILGASFSAFLLNRFMLQYYTEKGPQFLERPEILERTFFPLVIIGIYFPLLPNSGGFPVTGINLH